MCGDDTITVSLAAGTYTLLLNDANFLPIPVNPGSSSPFDLTEKHCIGPASFNGATPSGSGSIYVSGYYVTLP